MKYYAVKVGKQTGIFETWEECKKNTDGYDGATFKSFKTKEEAFHYLNDFNQEKIMTTMAYVDGSYDITTKRYSFGCVFFHEGEKYEFSKAFDDEAFAAMRNVAGEIKGAAFIIQFCINRGIKELHLYYDYVGIQKWFEDEWEANKQETIIYKNFAKKAKEKIKVTFHKVKSHSNDEYNDLADKLAKDALGI